MQSKITPLIPRQSVIDRKRFRQRAVLPERKDVLWKIETGVVRTMTWLEDGTTITLGLWGKGDIIGKSLSTLDPYQIECVTEVELTILHQNSWHTVTESFLWHIQQMEELALIRSHKTIEEMLLRLLAWLGKKFGHEVAEGQLINLRLTHQDLADLLASTRVTITRTLNQIERQGLISRLPHHLIVLQEVNTWHYEI